MSVVGSASERSSLGSLDKEDSSSEDSCVDFSSEDRTVDLPEEEEVLPGLSFWTGEDPSSVEGKTWRRGDCCARLVDLTEISSVMSFKNVAVFVIPTWDCCLDSITGELFIDLTNQPFLSPEYGIIPIRTLLEQILQMTRTEQIFRLSRLVEPSLPFRRIHHVRLAQHDSHGSCTDTDFIRRFFLGDGINFPRRGRRECSTKRHSACRAFF